MNQQTPTNLQAILTTPSQTTQSNQTTATNIQKIQQIATTTPTLQTNKNIQILNPLNPTFTIPQATNVTFTIDNSSIKSSGLKINQMTPSTIALIAPNINQINPNITPNTTTPMNTSTNTQSASNTPTTTQSNSATPSSATSSYGGFAYCSNCGEYGVKAAFYGKSKLYCSVACQNGIKKQQQQTGQGVKRTFEAMNQSPISTNTTQNTTQNVVHQVTPITVSSQLNTIQPVIQSNLIKTSHNFVQKSGPTTISTLLSQQQQQQQQQLQQTLLNSQSKTNESNNILHENTNSILQSSSVVMSPTTTLVSSPSYTNSQTSLIATNPAKRARKASNSSVSTSNSNTDVNSQNSQTTSNLLSTQLASKQPTTSTVTPSVPSTPIENKLSPPIPAKSPSQNLAFTFNWPEYLEKNPDCQIAPVYAFRHVSLSKIWKKMIKNLKVEIPNRDQPPDDLLVSAPLQKKCFWFASVVKIAGYWMQLRYLGYEEDGSADFWVHINDENLKSVGWSSDNGYSLTPPMKIAYDVDDWEEYAIENLENSKTLPRDLSQKIRDSLSSRFRKGMFLELVDKKRLSQMRVAKIVENIGGRLRLKYENCTEFDDFWCHEQSDLIHSVGWSSHVGHEIYSTDIYKAESTRKYQTNEFLSNDCKPDMFVKTDIINNMKNKGKFKKNMKLEAVDPLNLSSICVATVARVLNDGYLMIEIDGFKNNDGNDMFCYHRTSSAIFPAGFCQRNKLPLQPPFNYKKEFDWETYLKEENAEFAPAELFNTDNSHENPFKVGMKLESVDLIEPKLICVATVVAVVNRLIRLNFDGWDKRFDQWVDFESCDIYPVGWCHLVGYKLEQPPKNSEEKKPRGRKFRTKKN